MKIHPMGAAVFLADGQTDIWTCRHGEANSRFSQSCERT